MNKKGLSPVIATVLLISMALILGLIILMWARSWVGEKIQKDLGGGPQPIEDFCKDVIFDIDVTASGASINNKGNIPIYGIEIRKISEGRKEKGKIAYFGAGVSAGSSGTASYEAGIGSGLNSGDNVVAIPILLGETETNKKQHTCDEGSGIETPVL